MRLACIRSYLLLIAMVVGLLGPTIVFAQDRSTPECLNEQLTLDAFSGTLSSWYSIGGAPPGALAMTGPFGDPRFQDAGWEKWEYTMYFRQSRTNDPGYVQRQVVQIHYMVNRNTREVTQVKFKTTAQQGCVGERRVADSSDPDPVAAAADAESGIVPFGWYLGPAVYHLGSSLKILNPYVEIYFDPGINVLNNIASNTNAGGGGCGGDRQNDYGCPIQQ